MAASRAIELDSLLCTVWIAVFSVLVTSSTFVKLGACVGVPMAANGEANDLPGDLLSLHVELLGQIAKALPRDHRLAHSAWPHVL